MSFSVYPSVYPSVHTEEKEYFSQIPPYLVRYIAGFLFSWDGRTCLIRVCKNFHANLNGKSSSDLFSPDIFDVKSTDYAWVATSFFRRGTEILCSEILGADNKFPTRLTFSTIAHYFSFLNAIQDTDSTSRISKVREIDFIVNPIISYEKYTSMFPSLIRFGETTGTYITNTDTLLSKDPNVSILTVHAKTDMDLLNILQFENITTLRIYFDFVGSRFDVLRLSGLNIKRLAIGGTAFPPLEDLLKLVELLLLTDLQFSYTKNRSHHCMFKSKTLERLIFEKSKVNGDFVSKESLPKISHK